MTRSLALLCAVLAAAGCSTALLSPRKAETKQKIAQAEYLAGRGDYRAAIAKYEQTLRVPSQNPWQDKVLFNLGGLYASAGNPEPDFARSLGCFRRLRQEFPKSRFNAQSRVWLGLLEKIVDLESELEAARAELAENKHLLDRESARLEAERLEREAAWSAEMNLKARKLKELEALVESQKAALESLQRQLRKMKEIDIQSERKTKGKM
jgi:chemotaxis protein histidine kinase CheA